MVKSKKHQKKHQELIKMYQNHREMMKKEEKEAAKSSNFKRLIFPTK